MIFDDGTKEKDMKETTVRVPRMRRKRDGFAKFYAKRFIRISYSFLKDIKKRVQWNKNSIYRLSEPPKEKSRYLEIARFSAKKHKIPMREAWPVQY